MSTHPTARTFLRIARLAEGPRPAPRINPATLCDTCDGTGAERWFDADTGFAYATCRHCDGKARTGAYVVRLRVRVGRKLIEEERNYMGDKFALACSEADAWARELRAEGFPDIGGAECQVEYVITTAAGAGEREPCYTVRVWPD